MNNTKFNIIKYLMQAFISGVMTVLIDCIMYEMTRSTFIGLFAFIGMTIGTIRVILVLADKVMEERKNEQ